MIQKWLSAGRLMVRELELEDMAALKLCLMSLGLLLGLSVPRRKKPALALFSTLVFLGTYLPLMVKFLSCLVRTDHKEI